MYDQKFLVCKPPKFGSQNSFLPFQYLYQIPDLAKWAIDLRDASSCNKKYVQNIPKIWIYQFLKEFCPPQSGGKLQKTFCPGIWLSTKQNLH